MFCEKQKSFCLVLILAISILFVNTTRSHNVETILPQAWEQMCSFTQDSNILGHYVDHLALERVFSIWCHVTQDNSWDFATLQGWLKRFTGFTVFLTVECSERGTISLPWPMKAKGLVGLKVSNCRLQDKYADVMNPDISALPDQLRVLDMRNSLWLSDGTAFEFMIQPEVLLSMSADYDCGQDSTLEYMVVSNVTDMLLSHTGASKDHGTDPAFKHSASQEQNIHGSSKKSSTSFGIVSGDTLNLGNSDSANNFNDMLMKLSQSPNISDALAVSLNNPSEGVATNPDSPSQTGYKELLMNIKSVQHTCVFQKLKVLDESCPSVMSAHHFSIMVQSGSYPELRTMNYSFSGLPEIPRELSDFRLHFPKLSYLDLSKNLIRYVNVSMTLSTPASNHLSLDLRYNHITHINLNLIQSWAKIKDIYIDIRFNPIDCGCHMNDLLLAMKKSEFFSESMAPYKYLKEMSCYSPQFLKGRRLSSTELSCSGRLLNSLAAEHSGNTSLSQTNLAVLLVFCSLAAAALAVVVVVVIISFMKYGFPKVKKRMDVEMHQ